MDDKNRKPYPTDLTEEQYQRLAPLFESQDRRGRPLEYTLHEILNAIFYILRAGCAWRMLPHDLPPWPTVYYHFRVHAGNVQDVHGGKPVLQKARDKFARLALVWADGGC